MIDDTVERIRHKNHELMDELRHMIEEDKKLTPMDINALDAKVEKVGINDGDAIPRNNVEVTGGHDGTTEVKVTGGKQGETVGDDKPAEGGRKYIPRDFEALERKYDGMKNPKNQTTKIPMASSTKISPTRIPKLTKDPIKEPSWMSKSTKPIINPSQVLPKSVKELSKQPSNLLLDKLSNQDKEIEQLKASVKQLKNENNSLKQNNYQYQYNMKQINQQAIKENENLKSQYEDYMNQSMHENQKLSQQVEDLNLIINQKTLKENNNETKLMALKEIINTLNFQINDKTCQINDMRFKIDDLKSYNLLIKKLMQNIVDKFNRNLDNIGILIDNEYIEKNDDQVNNGECYTNPVLNMGQVDHDQFEDTNDLLFNNTTKQLLKKSLSPSLNVLLCNTNTIVKTPIVRLRIAAKFVLFLVKVKNSRRHR